MHIRKAVVEDAKQIVTLVNSRCTDGTMLPRTVAEVAAHIDTFTVLESDARQFLGCGALHVYGHHLGEIRSIILKPDTQGHGLGGELLKSIVAEANRQGLECVCLFTRTPGFFAHFGFHVAPRTAFADKYAKDCHACTRRNACDETPMAIGHIPPQGLQAARIPVQELVQLHA